MLYAAFDVDDTDTECDSSLSESDNSGVESQTEVSAVVCSRISVRLRIGSSKESLTLCQLKTMKVASSVFVYFR